MEILIGVLLVVGAIYAFATYRALRVVRQHSHALARITGIPQTRIYKEIVGRQITPGDWAAEHGLDPLTFEPRQPVQQDGPHQTGQAPGAAAPARGEADTAWQMWERVRLDDEAPLPSQYELEGIVALQREFAYLLRQGPLLAEANRQREILVALHEAGSRVDGEWVNATLERDGVEATQFSGPRSQEYYDDWQRGLVMRHNGEDAT